MADDGGGGMRLYVWAMGALALVTAGAGVIHARQLRALQAAIPRDEKSLLGDFAVAASEVQRGVAAGGAARANASGEKSDFNQFFERLAAKAFLRTAEMTISRPVETPKASQKYREVRYTITFKRATRNQISAFCYNCERERPYLATRRLEMKRDVKSQQDDWENVTVDIAWREPLAG